MRQKEDIPDHPDQAIHLPRHEASGRWLSASPGAVRSVYPNLVIGVNDKINRAALGGRYQSSFVERNWDPGYFSLRTLTHMSD